MSEPVYVYGSRRPSWHQTTTVRILALNVIMFIVQLLRDNEYKDFTTSWALSLPGLQEGNWWQLLTFQVIHGGYLHLLINSLLIFVMGSALEAVIGPRRWLVVYFIGGVMGGLLEMALKWMWPDEYPVAVVGASAGALALIGSFATLFPFQRLRVLIFFIIPVAMNARTLLWITIIFSLVGMTGLLHDHIAHAGHLGGILWGISYTWLRLRHLVLPPPLP